MTVDRLKLSNIEIKYKYERNSEFKTKLSQRRNSTQYSEECFLPLCPIYLRKWQKGSSLDESSDLEDRCGKLVHLLVMIVVEI